MRRASGLSGPEMVVSNTSATCSGCTAGTNRERMIALASAPVIVWTGGNPASSASISSATCGSRFTRIAARPNRVLERGAGRARRAAAGRCCRVGATRCGPSSTLRQIPIAVIRTGAARR